MTWSRVYLGIGTAVWVSKTSINLKHTFDKEHRMESWKDSIVSTTGLHILQYSPNIVLWPVSVACSAYKLAIVSYYETR
jgi:hypothetical protein